MHSRFGRLCTSVLKKMKKLLLCLAFAILANQVYAVNFKVVATLPEGQDGGYGFIRVADTDHNGYNELIFSVHKGLGVFFIVDYNYSPYNQYVFAETLAYGGNYIPWSVGYLDNDSLTDIIIQGGSTADSFLIFESRAYNSYPDSIVWRGGD